MSNSFGFAGRKYNQIIVFDSEDNFKKTIAANLNMTAIMGADDYTRNLFPDVFMAGIISSEQKDTEGHNSTAIEEAPQ